MVHTVMVVAGGMLEPPASLPFVEEDTFIVAADGGIDTALALGLQVDLAVGDFDSVSVDGLAVLQRAGTALERHEVAKDATDLQLALDAAFAADPARILVLGSAGGRLDHLLSSLDLLASRRYATVEVDAVLDGAQVHVIHGSRVLGGTPGELVSLHALHGEARGVATRGLLYPLAGETLSPGTSRGVSNVFVDPEAEVSLEQGVLLAIRPGLSA